MIAELRKEGTEPGLSAGFPIDYNDVMTLFIHWQENGVQQRAQWRSEASIPPHSDIVIVDDTLSADAAFRHAKNGTAMLWRGDWQNARLLLQALVRRVDKKRRTGKAPASPGEAFIQHREAQKRRAELLGKLLIPLHADYQIPLRRAQDVRQACIEAYGPSGEDSLVSLRELLAVVSAHEWRKKGVSIPAIGGSIHPHYGVFSPIRGEYIELVANTALPANCEQAFDIGTGTGVLAAVLAKRGIPSIIATDKDPRALACAAENIEKLGLAPRVNIVNADLFPEGKADLIVCNPPWVPTQPSSPIEYAVYDPHSSMLKGFLNGLKHSLSNHGEAWLILSDIAEHLGLRTREELLLWIDEAGLQVIERIDIRPKHPKTRNTDDALHAARTAEITSLWRFERNRKRNF